MSDQPKPTESKFPPSSGDCITDRRRQSQPKPTGEWMDLIKSKHNAELADEREKLAESSEWTVSSLRGMINEAKGYGAEWREIIADAHNASLADERKKLAELVDALIFIRDNAHPFGNLVKVAEDALAKVKEGK